MQNAKLKGASAYYNAVAKFKVKENKKFIGGLPLWFKRGGPPFYYVDVCFCF
jgi:hypothetical protein